MTMKRLLSVVLAGSLFSGCAKIAAVTGKTASETPAPGTGQLLADSKIRASGFLDDYARLSPVSGEEGKWEYIKPGVNWQAYGKIMIRPMQVWLNPKAERAAVQPQLYKQIEDAVRYKVTHDFEADGKYQVVNEAGPGVLVFRYAVTGITPVRQGLTPTDALPIKGAITAVRYMTGNEAYYIAMSVELEALDGATGERVYAVVGARRSFVTTLKSEEITWNEVKDSVTFFAEQWRTRLDRARGVTRQQVKQAKS